MIKLSLRSSLAEGTPEPGYLPCWRPGNNIYWIKYLIQLSNGDDLSGQKTQGVPLRIAIEIPTVIAITLILCPTARAKIKRGANAYEFAVVFLTIELKSNLLGAMYGCNEHMMISMH